LARGHAAAGGEDAAEPWLERLTETPDAALIAWARLENLYLLPGREEKLANAAQHLFGLLNEKEALAHAFLALWQHRTLGSTGSIAPLLRRAFDMSSELWVLRTAQAYARGHGQDDWLLEATQLLLRHAQLPLDIASLSLRAAELEARSGRPSEALQHLTRGLEAAPNHPVLLTRLADYQRAEGNPADAAEALEAFAQVTGVVEHQVAALLDAAALWLDGAGALDRGERALEQARELSPDDPRVLEPLERHYVNTRQRVKLAELLDRRIARTSDTAERKRLELERAQALARAGDAQAARAALMAVLETNPEDLDALDAYADFCESEGDAHNAEAAWLQLARVTPSVPAQADIYRRLARLYESSLPNAERAVVCYREVLRRLPKDVSATESLVSAYVQLGRIDEALTEQQGLLDRARDDDETRRWTLGMARIHAAAGQKRQAETVLLGARKPDQVVDGREKCSESFS
jgi:tetratricopeptide (TPR) repeat protein